MIGVLGLGTMGSNLALNIAQRRKPEKLALYNRSSEKIESFKKKSAYIIQESVDTKVTNDLQEFSEHLESKRTVISMLPSGQTSSSVMHKLAQYLSKGDVILDGANEHMKFSHERHRFLSSFGVEYLGVGISGGAQGARNNPCMMVGGNIQIYNETKEFLNSIGSSVYCGSSVAAGHVTKTIHNGIEYAMMQGIAEIYHYLKSCGASRDEIIKCFENMKNTYIDGYLIDATLGVLQTYFDLDQIDDAAAMNGTGLWTIEYGRKYEVALPVLEAAVDVRILSSCKEREHLPKFTATISKNKLDYTTLRETLEFVYATSLRQGVMLLDEYKTIEKVENMNIDAILNGWKSGTIIRCNMLSENNHLYVMSRLHKSARLFAAECTKNMVPCLTTSNAVNYYDMLHTKSLPTNLIMAQRNYFGEHKYKYKLYGKD